MARIGQIGKKNILYIIFNVGAFIARHRTNRLSANLTRILGRTNFPMRTMRADYVIRTS
jgi:hypothetical protein